MNRKNTYGSGKVDIKLSTPPVGIAVLRSRASPIKGTWFSQSKCARFRMHAWFSALVQMLMHTHLLLEQTVQEEKIIIRLFRIFHQHAVSAPGEEVLDSICEPWLPVWRGCAL